MLSKLPSLSLTVALQVAEKIQAPLYKMELAHVRDTEDSGSEDNDDEVNEDDVSNAFDRAAKWKAVLLIDECDMYLEKRSDASPKRNRLVARFLQKLEYYPSLLFLTTNRERVLDPAIYSRIHLTINYPALDAPSRRTIWSTFLLGEFESTVTEESWTASPRSRCERAAHPEHRQDGQDHVQEAETRGLLPGHPPCSEDHRGPDHWRPREKLLEIGADRETGCGVLSAR